MPTYEYACSACGHAWEQTQRITEDPVDTCPQCGKPSAHRLISAGTNFILKGSGWYSDLYASPKPAAEKAEKSDKSAEKTEKKAEKSESTAASSESGGSAAKPASTDTSGASSGTPPPATSS
jgi:putative FmdB family regulatory protein